MGAQSPVSVCMAYLCCVRLVASTNQPEAMKCYCFEKTQLRLLPGEDIKEKMVLATISIANV